jgi:hypothetical protein
VIQRRPSTLFIVNSRDQAGDFPRVALQLSFREAARILGERGERLTPEDAPRLAAAHAAMAGVRGYLTLLIDLLPESAKFEPRCTITSDILRFPRPC